jgi:hypothetical protein
VRTDDCAAHDLGRLVVQPNIVERELEGLLGRLDEVGDQARDVQRGLAAVRECVNLDQAWSFARSDALYARLDRYVIVMTVL